MIAIFKFYNDRYEGIQGTGDFVMKVRSVEQLPLLDMDEDHVYVAHELKRGGQTYELEERFPHKHTAFGRYGELVVGWWNGSILVKEFSRVPWGEQGVELPPGYSRLWQDDEGVLRLVSDAEYDELRAQWEAKHPRPTQLLGTAVAWWGGEGLDQYVRRHLQITNIKSATKGE